MMLATNIGTDFDNLSLIEETKEIKGNTKSKKPTKGGLFMRCDNSLITKAICQVSPSFRHPCYLRGVRSELCCCGCLITQAQCKVQIICSKLLRLTNHRQITKYTNQHVILRNFSCAWCFILHQSRMMATSWISSRLAKPFSMTPCYLHGGLSRLEPVCAVCVSGWLPGLRRPIAVWMWVWI